jgi:DNA-binding MarR family transcriptional regulator
MDFMHGNEDQFDKMRQHMQQHLLKYTNGADIQGLELSSLIRVVANYYSAAVAHKTDFGELSGPRMGILLRLLVAEESGNDQGFSPTVLSHFQNVKKNTISSLLSGLEEDGLIERTLDPEDKRAFKIRITTIGKELIKAMGPERLKMMNDLSSGLSADEKKQLIFLLEKLRKSIRKEAGFSLKPVPANTEDELSE